VKTAIASSGKEMNSNIDNRFGRSPFFAIYDHQTKETSFIDNPFKNEQGGVGPKIVSKLAENKVTKVVAHEFGPKAKDMLDTLNIQMVIIEDTNKTINSIIELMQS
jgi:predicted Fe-Mo cluster-binding NifX family protein